MNADVRRIYKAFGGKLVGRYALKLAVAQTLSLMPEKTVRYVCRYCWFVGSMKDAWAFTFTGNDLKNQHLIFLSDELLTQNMHQIRYTIAHEIGHAMLKHENSITREQSAAEVRKQEREAHKFALRYVSQ